MIKKIVISLTFLVSIMTIFIVIIIVGKNNNYARPNYDYIATIYHSEMLGMDAGTSYTYYIYKSDKNDNEYFYIKSKSNITITGSCNEEDIGSGSLKCKNDLNKIKKDIEKDFKKNSQSHVSYIYINSGINEEYDNINDFGNKLFK